MAVGNSLIVTIFSLLFIFDSLTCSSDLNHDQSIRKEVEDFADFLRLKTEKQVASEGNSQLQQSLKISADAPYEADNIALKNQDFSNSEDFEPLLQKRFQDVPYSEKHPPKQDISFRQSLGSDPRPTGVHSSLPVENPHHPVEEILYIRKSNSETNDPVSDVLEKLVQEHPEKEDITLHRGSEDKSTDILKDESFSDDPCFSNSFSSHLHQTCSEGPEYEMQFHPTFSEALKHDFEKMRPQKEDNKCDYDKILTTKDGVEDRALCPFSWSKTNHNKSRFPEYLYEAECSCQLSRYIRGVQYECKEIKRVIPVLWIVDCGPGTKKRYKEGWEEIAVACAPMVEINSNILPGNRDPR